MRITIAFIAAFVKIAGALAQLPPAPGVLQNNSAPPPSTPTNRPTLKLPVIRTEATPPSTPPTITLSQVGPLRFVSTVNVEPNGQSINVTNGGGSSLSGLSVTANQNWISAKLDTTVAPAILTITVTTFPTQRTIGGYISISATGTTTKQVTIQYQVNAAATPVPVQSMTLSTQSLNFVSRGVDPPMQIVEISAVPGTVLTNIATVVQPTGATWITTTLTSTQTPAQLVVQPSINGLAQGNHSAKVLVTARMGSAAITKQLDVQNSILPVGGTMEISPFSFVAFQGGPNPPGINMAITNAGNGLLDGISITSIVQTQNLRTQWLSALVSRSSDFATLTVNANIAGMPPNTYDGFVTVVASDAVNSPQTIPFKLVLNPMPVPVLKYSLEGNANNTGSAVGFQGWASNVSYTNGQVLKAASINGTNGCLKFFNTNQVFTLSNRWTICFWLNAGTTTSTTAKQVLSFQNGVKGWTTNLTATGLRTCTSAECMDVSLHSNGWNHIIYRYEESPGNRPKLDLYINGIRAGALQNAIGAKLIDTTVGFFILGTNTYFMFDEFQVYDQVFSEHEQCAFILGKSWDGQTCR